MKIAQGMHVTNYLLHYISLVSPWRLFPRILTRSIKMLTKTLPTFQDEGGQRESDRTKAATWREIYGSR